MEKKSFWKRQQTISSVKPINGMICVLPALISIFVLVVIPAMLTLALSFTDFNGDYSDMEFVWFENYVNFFTVLGDGVGNAFVNTFRYMLLMVLPLQILALGAALLVNGKLRGSTFFRAVFFLPSVLGISVVCTIWVMMYDPIDGFFANMLRSLYAVFPFIPESSAFLGDPDMSMIYIAITALWASFGYSMALYLAGLAGVSKDYYEAASLEGAGGFVTFFKITLPLIWPSVTICLWVALNGTLGMSEYIIFMTNGAHNTTTIGFYIYNMVMQNTASQGQASAVSIYFFLFTTTVMLLFYKFVRKRETDL